MFFPYSNVRPIQKELMELVSQCVAEKKHAIIHAPTGIGKTAAMLAPTIAYAIEHKKTILFLTSRHTQHLQAISTLRDIKNKSEQTFGVVDLIAKQQLCLEPLAPQLNSTEFSHFCREGREKGTCNFYKHTRKTDGVLLDDAKDVIKELHEVIHDTASLKELAHKHTMCPYELAIAAAQQATVIVADYYYLFHQAIQMPFLIRTQKDLEDLIIIIDEAHNLPNRIKDLASSSLSTTMLRRASKEADKYHEAEVASILHEIVIQFEQYVDKDGFSEQVIDNAFFKEIIDELGAYDTIKELLEHAGQRILEKQQLSGVLSIAHFMQQWPDEAEGFTRIFSLDMHKKEPTLTLSKKCLDPSVISSSIISACHSVLMMSGTLLPTQMYADLLGFDKSRTKLKEFTNPFDKYNALHWIYPEVTTKWNARNNQQFSHIAKAISTILEQVDGNTVVFFPSYDLLDEIAQRIEIDEPLLLESAGLSKDDKASLLNSFKEGGVLCAAATGNFGEGIDLPGDLLHCVIIVGLPLARPDAETNELIRYYDKKFGKGWDYGYTFPAFNITLQNAGRCIRSETDRGLIVYMDERYRWSNYFKCFPRDLNMVITEKLSVPTKWFEQ